MKPTTHPTLTAPDENCQIRCPRLGNQIYFSYCRTENMGAPCSKTLDCWYPYFPVTDYLRQELSSEEWEIFCNTPPTPRIESLMELIDQAQKRAQKAQKNKTEP